MSRIDDLIAELCPDGAEHRTLGELGEFVRGNGLQKRDLVDEGFPAVHYGEIHTHYGVWATQTKSFTLAETAAKLRKAKSGDLLIATTSEDDAAVAKATAWLGDGDVALSGDAYIYRHGLDPRYVAYFFQTEQFQSQKRPHVSGTKVRRVSGSSLAKIRIPVPPLEVQREIVRVLDQFTQLEAELEAELEARRRQFAFYRNQLLTLPETRGSRRIRLGDVVQIATDRSNIARLDGRNYVGVDNLVANFGGRVDARYLPNASGAIHFDPDDILISNIRPYLKKVWLADRAGGASPDVITLSVRPDSRADVLPKFLYFAIASDEFIDYSMKFARGAKMPRGDRAATLRYEFLLPTMADQQRVAYALEHFETLVNDLSIGLPAELSARRKQYEYYRDKLLTFEELPT